MVVPVGGGSSNNEQQGAALPESAGFCLQNVLQEFQRASRSTPPVSSMDMAEPSASASGAAADVTAAAASGTPLVPLKGWRFTPSPPPPLPSSGSGFDYHVNSNFLHQILSQGPSTADHPSMFANPSGASHNFPVDQAAPDVVGQSQRTKLLNLRDKSREFSRVKESAASHHHHRKEDARVGKMTSLGASPKCNVCSHKPNEARVVTFCGHLFCWPCLCCWLHNKSPNKECPVCNRPLTKNHITPLHGRQNSLTVARLQGMLRTEKPPPRTHSSSRSEGGRRQSKGKAAASSSRAAAGPVVSTVSSTIPPSSSPNVSATNDVEDSLRRILSGQVPSFPSQPPPTPDNSTIFSQAAFEEPSVYSYPEFSHPVAVPGTMSTAVTTSYSPVDLGDLPDRHEREEMNELGVLLSLEWEGAMSAIENAWWGAVSDVFSRSETVDDASNLMTAVERLSKEKEKIILELASEPLEAYQWLPTRLDVFRTMTSRSEQDLHEVDDYVFPELSSPEDESAWWMDMYEQPAAEVAKRRKIRDDERRCPL